jgi:hypothetical protein
MLRAQLSRTAAWCPAKMSPGMGSNCPGSASQLLPVRGLGFGDATKLHGRKVPVASALASRLPCRRPRHA